MTAAAKPPRRVHATETFWMIVCTIILIASLGGCAAMILDGYTR